MKRIIAVLILCLSITAVFTGCSKNSSTQGNNNGNQGNKGQMERADLMGEVSEIVGNEVKLKVIKMPERPTGTPENPNGGKPNITPGTNPGGNGSWQPGTQQGGTGQSGQTRNRQREYTGEVKTIIIPVGIKITTMTRGQNGVEQKEVNISEIKQGTILQIYYADDGKTIEKITTMTSGGGRRNASGN